MKKVILGYVYHREKEWISLLGPDELVFNGYVKKCKAVWTKTPKKVKSEKTNPSDDYDSGLRDWELRNT